jgi:hypothetical protein
MTMTIETVSDFRRAMRSGPYAFPGGYPLFFVMADGEALSFKAARDNRRELLTPCETAPSGRMTVGCRLRSPSIGKRRT